MSTYIKDPQAILDYGFDWSDWLADGETIIESTWVIDPAESDGLEKDTIKGDSFEATGGTTIWLGGGTDGEDYTVTNHVKTSDDREDDRSHKIKVRQR